MGFGIAALAVSGNLAFHALTQVHPDYQIAYVGSYPLSEEEAAAWEERLSALGSDCDGDGRVVAQLNQYPTGGNGDDLMYAAASSVKLITQCFVVFAKGLLKYLCGSRPHRGTETTRKSGYHNLFAAI